MTTGSYRTLAGMQGNYGFSGDNGNATSAKLRNPMYVTFGKGDMIYISDTGNNRIRAVNLTSEIITTLAGGGTSSANNIIATNASIDAPKGLAMDINNNQLLYTDSTIGIRAVNLMTGTVTTLISGSFFSDIALDSTNSLIYILVGNRVRVTNRTSGATTFIAGTGFGGFNGEQQLGTLAMLFNPYTIALDSFSNYLHIADAGNNKIRSVSLQYGYISNLAGSTTDRNSTALSTSLDYPSSIIFDDTSNSLIVSSSMVLSSINIATGLINTIAGTGTIGNSTDGFGDALSSSFTSKYGVAELDDTKNLVYFTDITSGMVKVLNRNTKTITLFAGGGNSNVDSISAFNTNLQFPSGLAIDSANNLVYISDTNNHRIKVVNITSGLTRTVAGTGVGGYNNDNVDGRTANLQNPRGISLDPINNLLYIADYNNNRIRVLNLNTGNISTFAGTGQSTFADDAVATNGKLANPCGVTVDTARNVVYIADLNNHRIRMVNRTSGSISTIAGTGWSGYDYDNVQARTAKLNGPRDLALDSSRSLLYIADTENFLVRVIDLSSGIISRVAGNRYQNFNGESLPALDARLNSPYAVAVDSSTGYVYVGDSGNKKLRMIRQITAPVPISTPTPTTVYPALCTSPVNCPCNITIADPSFESLQLQSGAYTYLNPICDSSQFNSTNSLYGRWSFFCYAAIINGITNNNSWTTPFVPSGKNILVIQQVLDRAGFVFQSIMLYPGVNYQVSLYAAIRHGYPQSIINVTINGTTVFTVLPEYRYKFKYYTSPIFNVSISGTYVLGIIGANIPSTPDVSTFIDDVKINAYNLNPDCSRIGDLSCFGILYNSSAVCSGIGMCVSQDNCQCTVISDPTFDSVSVPITQFTYPNPKHIWELVLLL
ncbi:NHL repeat-containing protein [Acrasis kona]|uniref:NHL repeat-containing protein n=1 Tax=Acrasis kona TaxID=1008807 RepID=A0AAW2Z894_9EUKA